MLIKVNKLIRETETNEINEVEFWVNTHDIISVEAIKRNQIYLITLRDGRTFETKLHVGHLNQRLAEVSGV